MMYANPKYDISDEVLDNLGASMGTRKSRSGSGTQEKSNVPSAAGTGEDTRESKEPRK